MRQSLCHVVLPRSRCSRWRSWGDPRVAPRLVPKGVFRQLFPDEFMRIPADRTNVEREIWWKAQKGKDERGNRKNMDK